MPWTGDIVLRILALSGTHFADVMVFRDFRVHFQAIISLNLSPDRLDLVIDHLASMAWVSALSLPFHDGFKPFFLIMANDFKCRNIFDRLIRRPQSPHALHMLSCPPS